MHEGCAFPHITFKSSEVCTAAEAKHLLRAMCPAQIKDNWFL